MARKLTSLDLDNKVRLAIAALQKVPSRLGLSEAEWIETVRRGSREQVSAADALMVMAGSLDGKKVYDGRSYTRGAIKCAEYGQGYEAHNQDKSSFKGNSPALILHLPEAKQADCHQRRIKAQFQLEFQRLDRK